MRPRLPFPLHLRLFLLGLLAVASHLSAADLANWPSQYTISPWETAKLTPADVVGPDGIVYPDFTGVGVTGGIPDINNSTVRATYTVFNVKTGYGATGNGTTNDDTVVANAAAAVKAHSAAGGKSILYLPTGTHLLSQPVIFGIQGTATNFVANNIVVDRDSPTCSIPRSSNSASVNR